MTLLDQIPFHLDSETLFKRLHLEPDSDAAAEVLDVARRTAALARPRAIFTECFVETRPPETVQVGEAVFTSRVLCSNLASIHRVFAYIATCGPEMDTVAVEPDDFFGQFCRDTVKEMALFTAREQLVRQVKEQYGLTKITSMAPGSGDAQVWPIQQQKQLFSLFGDVEALIGVRLTDTCLMLPNKSVSGIFYPTEVAFKTCRLCHREQCPNRQAPFDAALWQEKMEKANSAR